MRHDCFAVQRLYRSEGACGELPGGVWVARWEPGDSSELVLEPGGTVANSSVITRWLPHKGWSPLELAQARIPGVMAAESKAEPLKFDTEPAEIENAPPTFGIY